MKIRIFPYYAFVLQSALSPEQTLNVIQANTQEKVTGLFRPEPGHRYFKGKVHEKGFLVERIISYRNSFLPVVEGAVSPDPSRAGLALVRVSMMPNPFVIVFGIIWFSFASLITLGIIATVTSKHKELWPVLIPIFIIFSGTLIFAGGFWFEALKQEAMLKKLLSERSAS